MRLKRRVDLNQMKSVT